MTLLQLLDSWRLAPNFAGLRQLSRQEISSVPLICLDKYYYFDGHTPPNVVKGHNTDVLILNPGQADEEALVVDWG